MTEGAQRRLAAIVSADVVGYSRLMGADEEGTLAALKSCRNEIINPKTATYNGRIFKTTGDGIFSEFPSVVDAVQCWLDVQQDMLKRNEDLPAERRIQFRVGINLGDVIVDGDDLYGEGVNIAARLEAISAPGSICISSAVIEQVRRKLDLSVEDLGARGLKNIEEPVHVYRIIGRDALRSASGQNGKREYAGELDLALPERPSLAILPFRNLNGDAENDFIADGIGLGIQTLLVQLSGLFFVNVSSEQGYREGKKTAAEAVRDLPVRYVLEGSAQRAGQRVRVTVQLTDVKESGVVWAERYDRELEDVFALQDDITHEVITSLNGEFFSGEFLRVAIKELSGDGAWEYFLRGASYIYKFNKEDNLRAREMFEKLYALRPDKVQGAGYIALTYWLEAMRGWTDTQDLVLQQAGEWAEKATTYESNDGIGHVVLSYIRLLQGRHDEALALCEKSVEFRSNCPAALGQVATVKLYCGDASGAVRSARDAMTVRSMNPPGLINLLATAYRDSGEIDMSIPAAREALRLDPKFADALATLCCDHVLAGDDDEAHRIASELLEIEPKFSTAAYAGRHPYKDSSTINNITQLLHRAGLPD